MAEALALLVGRERIVRQITDWDFFRGDVSSASRFHIIGTITDLTEDNSNDPGQVPEWFCGENSARPAWWHESSGEVTYETDPPQGASLAAEIALSGRFDEDSCDFELARYFYYGTSDPFVDGYKSVPIIRLRELGLFLLPGNRQWDRLLSFGSSTFLKVVREYNAIPGDSIDALKRELKDEVTKTENSSPLSSILEQAEKELKSFLIIGDTGKIAFRPTPLDTISVMRSLVAHLDFGDFTIPVANHGSGMISLQSFLVLLAFAEHRKRNGRNFILVAEEPELHLHPSLHQRLVHRIRAASTQSIVTTQSPQIASCYQPKNVVYLSNESGELSAPRLRAEPVSQIPKNAVRKLYLQRRSHLYEALMGSLLVIPEGEFDYEWLTLWQRFAQSVPDPPTQYELRPVSIVPTCDGSVVDTFEEVARFRPDALPIVDGDNQGLQYQDTLCKSSQKPKVVIRFGKDAAIECLSAWILEPALTNPSDTLRSLLPDSSKRNLKNLQECLCIGTNKKDRSLREELVWEVIDNAACCNRALEFFHDISAIVSNGTPINLGWVRQNDGNGVTLLLSANQIERV